MLAGMEKSTEFHEKREACIRKKYNADEIGQRILNGDGGSWIKEPYDPDTIFQLDRYHICQEILRKISDKEAQKEIRRLYDEEKTEEMFAYIETMQSVWKVRRKRIREAKRQENCISIYIITGRVWCPTRRGECGYRSRRKGWCIKGWGYRKARTVQ